MVARLLTPMMAAYVLKNNPKPETDSWLMQRYLKAVAACLKYRGRTAAAAILFVIGSLALVPLLPTGFISPSDDSMTTVSLKLAPGSKLEETEAAVLEATRRLQKVNHVTQVYAVIGDATSDAASSAVNEATLTVSLTPRADRSRSQSQIEGDIRQALWTLPGVQVAIAAESNGQVMEVTITSDDSTALATAANNITRDLRSLKDLGNVSSSSSVVRPEIHITPDPEKNGRARRDHRSTGQHHPHCHVWGFFFHQPGQAEPATTPVAGAGTGGPGRAQRSGSVRATARHRARRRRAVVFGSHAEHG